MPVDLLAAGVPQALVLLALRVGGMLLIAPAFSSRTVPVKVRTALLLLLTLLLAGPAVAAARGGLAGLQVTPAAFLAESLVGFAIGFGAAVLVGAAEAAGDLMSTSAGLSGAALLDPLTGASNTALAQFAQLFALTVLLGAGGHLVMLGALAESVRAVPLGAAVDARAALGALVAAGAALFALGLKFAAPVIAAAVIGNVALAVLTRVAPALNVFTVAFPLQIGLGLTAAVAALVGLATWLGGWPAHLAGVVEPFFAAAVPR